MAGAPSPKSERALTLDLQSTSFQGKTYAIFQDDGAIRAQISAAKDRLGGRHEVLSVDQQDLNAILKNLRRDPERLGALSLGTDGVLRTLTRSRDVIDAVALSRRLCKAMLDRYPWDQEIEDDFRGVNGLIVPREKWFQPDTGILPIQLSEDETERIRKKAKERWDLLLEQKVRIDRGEVERMFSRPTVISDYNIEPR